MADIQAFAEMIKVRRQISDAAWCIVCLRLWTKTVAGELLQDGWATGFFYGGASGAYIITNWHVVTARSPDSPGKLLDGHLESPSAISFDYLSMATNPPILATSEKIPLYNEGEPIWLQCDVSEHIDLVAIPLTAPDHLRFWPIQSFNHPSAAGLEAGHQVFVVGYSFQRSLSMPSAIWKSAFVASEPILLALGKTQILLDTPGRPGMSGSPVFQTTAGYRFQPEQVGKKDIELFKSMTEEQQEFRALLLTFVGIYAGTYGDQELEKLNLGRMVPAGFLIGMIDKGLSKKGVNPFPPSVS